MRKMWASALALTAGMSGLAEAQTDDDVVLSEEIIVTVQRRAQDVLEVPVAVTAYSAEELERLGVQRFEELALHVPGLEIQEQSANNPAFVIRGITSDSGEATNEPRVAIFQDGVSLSRSRGSYVELFDLERIEIARGPQATLYGRGALIGAIGLIQNKVDLDDWSGSLQAGYGDNGYQRGVAVLNAPLVTDTLGVRVALTARERDGFNDNLIDAGDPLGTTSLFAVRASVAWAPTSALRFDLIGNYQEDDNAGTSFKARRYAPCAPTGVLTQECGTSDPFSPAALNTSAGFEQDRPLGLEREVSGVTLLGEWEISPVWTLNSTTGYRFFTSHEVFDPDGFGLPLLVAAEAAKGMQWSQDFRLGYDRGGPLSWFIGASYTYEDGHQRVPFQFDERIALAHLAGQITTEPQPFAVLTNPAFTGAVLQAGFGVPAPFAPGVAAALKPAHVEEYTNYGSTESIDLYGDATWRVSERFELSAGLRWTQDDKEAGYGAALPGSGSVLGSLMALVSLPPLQQQQVLTAIATTGQTPLPVGLFSQPTNGVATQSDTFDDLTWRLVGRYAASDNISLWASYARGRRPEVISPNGPAAPGAPVTFDIVPAETVDSIEVGARARLFDDALRFEGSVYRYEYENFQTSVFDGAQLITINAGEASAVGIEGQVDWRANEWLELFGTTSFSHARLDSGAREGNQFRLSPDVSFSLGAELRRDWSGVGAFSLVPTYTWQSEIFFDDDNDDPALQQRSPASLSDFAQDERQTAYGLWNLRARYETPSGRWALEAFVNNIENRDYIIDAGNTGDLLGIPTFIRGAGRTAGVEVKAQF